MNACEVQNWHVNAGANYGKLQRGTGTRPATLKEMRDKRSMRRLVAREVGHNGVYYRLAARHRRSKKRSEE